VRSPRNCFSVIPPITVSSLHSASASDSSVATTSSS
jgi:hypothetical protein